MFILWTPPFIGDRLKHQEVDKCIWEPFDNHEFIIVVDIVGHYIPCLLIIAAYIKVYIVMRKRSKVVSFKSRETTTINITANKDSKEKDQSRSQASVSVVTTQMQPSTSAARSSSINTLVADRSNREQKIFRTLTYVITSYLLCWFPFYVTWDIYAWKPSLVPDWLYTFLFWMTYINSTLNPVLYAYTNKDFRQAFKNIVKCSCQNNTPPKN